MRIGIAVSVIALAGCASAPERSIRQMRLAEEEVAGQRRLFSTFGFWVLEEPLRKKLLPCYTPEGKLDRLMLRQSLPEAQIVEAHEVVAVTLPSGAFASFLLRDGPLVSLDPKTDAIVRMVADEFSSRGRLPVVPITPR
jgi:hypothetical protein